MNLKALLEQLKVRRVRKTMAIYMSAAVTTIGIVKIFLEVYPIPSVILPVLVTVLTCGIGSAFVFAWYHGGEGPQKFRKHELLVHGLFLAVAVVLSYQIIGMPKVRLTAARVRAVAVLPFKNMSESKEDEYFSDGITEDILTQLSKISDLQVISRSSAMKYKNTEKSLREIGEELSVGSILEGTIRRVGNRV